MRALRNGTAGFSLIELIVATAITGILGSVAASRFGGMTARAHRIEARAILGAVASAELANRFTTITWACTFDELLTIDGVTRIGAAELQGARYTYQIACDADGNYTATATANADADAWLDLAVASPATRFALRYDDLFDTYDPNAGAVTTATPAPSPSSSPVATATPTPVTTPPPATPVPTATPKDGKGGKGK